MAKYGKQQEDTQLVRLASYDPQTLSGEGETDDSFWPYKKEIDPTAWNTRYPYQLIVLDDAHQRIGGGEWIFELPFPPQDLTLSVPMAINTTPTFGGIVEEHNGAPIRMIGFSGTLGINPERGSAITFDSYKWAENSVRVASISSNLLTNTSITNARPLEGTDWLNTVPDSAYTDQTSALAQSTGYYRFRELQRFLERYISLKKKSSGAKYRLAFAIWKDDAVYLVTPVQFEVKRSASSPLEYMYTLQLKAWRRVNLSSDLKDDEEEEPSAFAPGYMQKQLEQAQFTKDFFQQIQEVRYKYLNTAFNAISTAASFSRMVLGYYKTALGLALFVADLTPELLMKLAEEQETNWERVFGYEPKLITRRKKLLADKIHSRFGPSEIATMGVGNVAAMGINSQSLSNSAAQVDVTSLDLSPTLLKLIEAEKESYKKLTRADFESMRDELMAAMSEFASSVGLSTDNATVNSTSVGTIGAATQAVTEEPTEADYQTMFAMNRLAMVLNSLAASGNATVVKRITPMDYVAGLATSSSIAFKVPQSKFGVPFPYGYTLEQLARDYLKDPNRWMEIATLNGLQAPYVDDVGVEVPLVVNGAENTLVVELPADTAIVRGQPITIAATGVPREKRYVQHVDKRDSVTIIKVDGAADLGKFTLNGKAAIHFYRPNTVNSQMMIYIPSDQEPAENDYATKSIPGLANLQSVIAAGGVDLLLTNSMDLAITPDGDCKLALGLTNIIQRVKTLMITPTGGLLQHPTFGLGLTPGMSTADADAQSVFNRMKSYLKTDPAFRGIQSVLINKTGPSLSVSVLLGVNGVNQNLPITVDVKQ